MMRFHAASALLAASLFPALLVAQRAQITGRVTDPSAAVIASVEVRVTHTDTDVTRTAATNELGYYTLPLLPHGKYRVAIQHPGFRSVEHPDVVLQEDQVLRLDFTLQVGEVTENITVTGTSSLIQTSTSEVSTVIPNQRVLDLPMRGRNFFALVGLVPGVRPIGGYNELPVAAFGSSQASIAGGAPGVNNLMVDGVAAEGVASGAFNVFLSVDAIEEFRIISRNASAEYGRTGGGVINVVSKSGTNQFHGALFEFHRNRVLNANGFFANRIGQDQRPPLVYNQYGATAGGPVLRDRTFFYFNFEQVKRRNTNQTFRTVPTELQRRGDFSQTRAANGQQIRIFDPVTTRLDPARPGSRIRDPFPGNLIPTSRMNPVAQAMLKYYPAPNSPGLAITEANNFFGQGAAPLNKDTWGVKIDHNFDSNQRLSGRVTWEKTALAAANFFQNIAEPNSPGSTFPRRSFALNYTDAIRPTLLLEARAGMNRFFNRRIPRPYGFDITEIGLPAPLRSQVQYPLMPRFTPAGVSEIGPNQNDFIRQANDAWSVFGAVTRVSGSHVWKIGAEERIYLYNNNQNGPVLSFDFSTNFTRGPDPNVASATAGHGFAGFLLGMPGSGSSRRWASATMKATNFGVFIQDDWKASPRLTLNLGLRWEFEGAVTDRFNAIANFDPALETTASGVRLRGGLIYPGVSGIPRGMRDNSWTDFGPRFGFAYQLLPKTVLRGGIGLLFLPGTGFFVTPQATGFDIVTAMVTSVDGGFTPYRTLSDPFPEGIQLPPGSSLGPLTALGSGVSANVRNLRTGYSEQWNANIQRDLPGGWLVEVGYIGNHGVHLPVGRTLGYLPSQYLSLGTALQQQVPNPYYGLITVGTLSQPTVTLASTLRYYPQFTSVGGMASWANSIYHALTVRVEKRLTHGLSLLLAYTNSKLIDDNLGNGANSSAQFSGGGSNDIQNWDNLRADRAISGNDLPQRLVISTSWELPFPRSMPGALRQVFGGWQLNPILTMQSGVPMAITATAPAFGGNRPNVVGDPNVETPKLERWFNTDAFAVIPPFTFGNGPRNLPSTRTDGLFNLDISVQKNFRIRERVLAQFRAEAFNATNTPTFGTPGTGVASTQFGVVSSTASSPRDIQLGLKVYF
jgi:hypothetical protein